MEISRDPRDVAFWQERYERGTPPWDAGVPAPPLVRAVEERVFPERARVLVPGCGYGHEALFLARRGFEVVAVDFAPGAVAQLKEHMGELPITVLERDIFLLERDFAQYFDLVVEHTCFCAIPLNRRGEYAQLMSAVLKKRGALLGLFWELEDEDGPPYRTTSADIDCHFLPFFEISSIECPADSLSRGVGQEWLVFMEKRVIV